MSRSPSPASGDESDAGGEKGDTRGRYVSRSPSFSPDRQDRKEEVEAGERIEGDI